MYKVELTPESEKNLSRLPKEYQSQSIKPLKKLSSNPLEGKPLGGKFRGQYSLRFGVYRIIYVFSRLDKIILVLAIKHRKEAYG